MTRTVPPRLARVVPRTMQVVDLPLPPFGFAATITGIFCNLLATDPHLALRPLRRARTCEVQAHTKAHKGVSDTIKNTSLTRVSLLH